MIQRVHTDSKPMYWKGQYDAPQAEDTHQSFENYRCGGCNETSPVNFAGHPALCLNQACNKFFSINDVSLERKTLEYTPAFLKWNKPFSGDLSQLPASITTAPIKADGEYGTELRFRTGMVCPQCSHCDSRVAFNYWKCLSCGVIQKAEPEPYPMEDINQETKMHTAKLMKSSPSFKKDKTTISIAKDTVEKFSIQTQGSTRIVYVFRQIDGTCVGTLVHERPSPATLQGPGGADELLKDIQEPAVAENFKRYAARNAGSECPH